MTPALENTAPATHSWSNAAWFGLLLLLCYAPILRALAHAWIHNEDMGHGFFVPLVAGYIVWQRRDELLAAQTAAELVGPAAGTGRRSTAGVATLGAEVFLARLSFVVTLTAWCGCWAARRF